MIAIVEHHKIGEPAGKIAGMIIEGFFVRVDVLDIIEDHDDKEGYLLGDDDEENGFPPVQQEGDDDKKAEYPILGEGQVKFISFILIKAPEVVHDRTLLEIAADGRVGKEGQDVIGFAEAIGNGEISFAVIELVMIFIVCRRPGKGGESVEKGNPVIGYMVEEG
jgi:hypothetical protein